MREGPDLDQGFHSIQVQVIGRLIQKQDVRILKCDLQVKDQTRRSQTCDFGT